METLRTILRESPAGQLSNGYRTLVLSLFTGIVLTSIGMLAVLLTYGHQIPIRFGY